MTGSSINDKVFGTRKEKYAEFRKYIKDNGKESLKLYNPRSSFKSILCLNGTGGLEARFSKYDNGSGNYMAPDGTVYFFNKNGMVYKIVSSDNTCIAEDLNHNGDIDDGEIRFETIG